MKSLKELREYWEKYEGNKISLDIFVNKVRYGTKSNGFQPMTLEEAIIKRQTIADKYSHLGLRYGLIYQRLQRGIPVDNPINWGGNRGKGYKEEWEMSYKDKISYNVFLRRKHKGISFDLPLQKKGKEYINEWMEHKKINGEKSLKDYKSFINNRISAYKKGRITLEEAILLPKQDKGKGKLNDAIAVRRYI